MNASSPINRDRTVTFRRRVNGPILFIFAGFAVIFGAVGIFQLVIFTLIGLANEGIIFMPIAFMGFALLFGSFCFAFRVTIQVSREKVVVSALRGLNKLVIPMKDVMAVNEGPTTGLSAGVGTREYRGMKHCYIAGGTTVQIDFINSYGHGDSMLASTKNPQEVIRTIRRFVD